MSASLNRDFKLDENDLLNGLLNPLAYGLPATLSISLQSHLLLSDSQYTYLVSALYTAFSAPNMVLPFFSGCLVQRYGERRVLLAAATCVVTGQVMFAPAIEARQIWAIIFGRTLFGLGGEMMGVLANTITTRKFTLVIIVLLVDSLAN